MADYESEFLGVSGGNSGQSMESGTAQIKIVTLGIGGGGNNTIQRLLKVGVKGTELVAVEQRLESERSRPAQ